MIKYYILVFAIAFFLGFEFKTLLSFGYSPEERLILALWRNVITSAESYVKTCIRLGLSIEKVVQYAERLRDVSPCRLYVQGGKLQQLLNEWEKLHEDLRNQAKQTENPARAVAKLERSNNFFTRDLNVFTLLR